MGTNRETTIDLIKRYLHSTESSWSNGISGAIAEFMYDAGESVSFGESATALHAVTDRGAIAVNLAQEPACFAHEDITHCTGSWTQVLSLALPEALSDACKPCHHGPGRRYRGAPFPRPGTNSYSTGPGVGTGAFLCTYR